MNESILTTIKTMLGFPEDAEIPFTTEIVTHINSAFATLTQLGLGPTTGFSISGPEQVWGDIIPADMNLENVKQYIFLKTKVLFDSPASGGALETMKEQIKECEFRIQIEVDER